jgi:KaiC/GvpD/RAD55 family RecA-like ATPase
MRLHSNNHVDKTLDRSPSGIKSLDELIEGGFPRPSLIGLIGEVESRKTTLCYHIAWNALQRGSCVLHYSIDQSSDDVIAEMAQFGWNVEPYIKKGILQFVDVFSRGMQLIAEKIVDSKEDFEVIKPDKVSKIFPDLREMIMEGQRYFWKAETGGELIVVYDSLTSLFTTMDRRNVLRFLQYAKYASRLSNAVGIAVLDSGIHGAEIENACRQLADGVIEMRKKTQDGYTARYIRIGKMARTKSREEYYPLELTDSGLVVYRLAVTF